MWCRWCGRGWGGDGDRRDRSRIDGPLLRKSDDRKGNENGRGAEKSVHSIIYTETGDSNQLQVSGQFTSPDR
jgi:hypothetical protein